MLKAASNMTDLINSKYLDSTIKRVYFFCFFFNVSCQNCICLCVLHTMVIPHLVKSISAIAYQFGEVGVVYNYFHYVRNDFEMQLKDTCMKRYDVEVSKCP